MDKINKEEFYNGLYEWEKKEYKPIKRKLFIPESLKKLLKRMAKKFGIDEDLING